MYIQRIFFSFFSSSYFPKCYFGWQQPHLTQAQDFCLRRCPLEHLHIRERPCNNECWPHILIRLRLTKSPATSNWPIQTNQYCIEKCVESLSESVQCVTTGARRRASGRFRRRRYTAFARCRPKMGTTGSASGLRTSTSSTSRTDKEFN